MVAPARTLGPALVLVLVLGAGLASAQGPVWPMGNGSHDVLHSFQNPFAFSFYFHEGVDLRGSLVDVVAVRDGVVRYVNQGDAGGNLVVEVTTAGRTEADSYLHVILDPWLVGDSIQAGDRVGIVNDNYFSRLLQDHVHVNRFSGYAGGNGYVSGRTNMLHPLELFAAAADRDPQTSPAQPEDADEDGFVFHVAPNNQPAVHLPFAFRAVELVLEATDRLSSTLYWNQGLVGVGYWVEALSGGEDVASAAQPYRLLRFDDAWRASSSNCDSLVTSVMVRIARVEFGPDDTGWTMLANYRLTETSGFSGLASAISNAQAWVTDARVGSGTGNGTDALVAREIAEARFQDGRVLVHALTEDLESKLDTPFAVVVDNFRPYVKTVRVLDGAATELYRSGWSFDPGTSSLSFGTGYSIPDFQLGIGDVVTLEIEFSEPMASATVDLSPPVGLLPPLSSAQGPDERRLWSTSFVLSALPVARHLTRVRLKGTDLNGTTLFPFLTSAAHTAPFNKRVNVNPLTTPTVDALHVLPLARRRATTGPP